MCKECCEEAFPERQTTCLDDGVYLLNWQKCAKCGDNSPPLAKDRETKMEEEEIEVQEDDLFAAGSTQTEETTFNHVCSACDHVICEHYYKFEVVGPSNQDFMMECLLCGKGAETVDFSAMTSDTHEYKGGPPTSVNKESDAPNGSQDVDTSSSAPELDESPSSKDIVDEITKVILGANLHDHVNTEDTENDDVQADEWD